jgi:hypothetical protein
MRGDRSGYNEVTAGPRRDELPNNAVANLVKTDRG